MAPRVPSTGKPNAWFRPTVTEERVPVQSTNEGRTETSSISSPSTNNAEYAEVDALLEGIDHVRKNDLWTTPPSSTSVLTVQPEKKYLALPPNALNSKQSTDVIRVDCTRSAIGGVSQKHPSTLADPEIDFPQLFKVYPCPAAAACYANGMHTECFYYHDVDTDRRRGAVSCYRPYMCRFVGEPDGCRKGDRCPFAHNDFERRYHPDRFGKEICRDYLRDDCPRRYCTFRHEVSDKVEAAIIAMDAMNDKELVQLVLKLSVERGRTLSEKLARRFGYTKKHSGWRLERFDGGGNEKVAFLFKNVEDIRRHLRLTGERRWAAILKTMSLRDMMSGVRKVTEEIRERIYNNKGVDRGVEMQRLIRVVFSNANWSCHSQEGENPFVVTPENQTEAVTALQRLVEKVVSTQGIIPFTSANTTMDPNAPSFLRPAPVNGAAFIMDPIYEGASETRKIRPAVPMWQ